MLLGSGVLGLVMLGVWIFCIVDVITTPDGRVRNLPKLAWLLIVALLATVGSIAWLIAGRPWGPRVLDDEQRSRMHHPSGLPARPARPGRAARPARTLAPDDDPEFLAGLQARVDEQRRRAQGGSGREPDATGDETP